MYRTVRQLNNIYIYIYIPSSRTVVPPPYKHAAPSPNQWSPRPKHKMVERALCHAIVSCVACHVAWCAARCGVVRCACPFSHQRPLHNAPFGSLDGSAQRTPTITQLSALPGSLQWEEETPWVPSSFEMRPFRPNRSTLDPTTGLFRAQIP